MLKLRRRGRVPLCLMAAVVVVGCRSETLQDRPRFSRERMQKMIEARKARDKAPKPGDPAPGFALSTRDGASTVELAQFRGEKPVVLIFGSYT